MTSSVIEAELYSKHHDLLFAYFGISVNKEKRNRIASIRRKIKLKQELEKNLRAQFDPTAKRNFGDRIKYNNFIIRSIDDDLYPENEVNSFGISPWFKVEPFDFYHNGINVIIGIVYVEMVTENKWKLADEKKIQNYDKYIKCFIVGRIPYTNIVAYDLDGDSIENCPHFYCDFANNGMPYEEIVYLPIQIDGTDNFYWYFENKNRTE